jgi:nicotinamidase-related amidase
MKFDKMKIDDTDSLTLESSQLVLIDHQPQLIVAMQSDKRQTVVNNVVALADAATVFGIATTVTTVRTEGFSGKPHPELLEMLPDQPSLERGFVNAWDDPAVRRSLAGNCRRQLVVSGLWMGVGVNCSFVLSAMRCANYEVFVVADASGGISDNVHETAMVFMVRAGAIPVTGQRVMLEWQRRAVRHRRA